MIDWEKLHNSHQGEIGIIVCSGPSLKDTPLELLKRYCSFGFNNIFLLQKFTPNYYFSINPLVIAQSRKRIEEIQCSAKFIKKGNGFVNDYEIVSQDCPEKFSLTPQISVHEGHTVTHVALQLAYYIGFQVILIVGCDHRFTFNGDPDRMNHMIGDDPNHFTPTYFKDQFWQNPNLEESAISYAAAKKFYELDYRIIINLTPNSALDVFEKGKMEDW